MYLRVKLKIPYSGLKVFSGAVTGRLRRQIKKAGRIAPGHDI